MANIPLAQIPNAPQTANTVVPVNPSAIRAPNLMRAGQLADVDTRGLDRGVQRIAQSASLMRQEALGAEAFGIGMGRGLEALGNSGVRASAALGDFAVRLGRAHDEAQMAELDAIRTDLVSRFEEEILTKPADQWESAWQRYDSQLAERGASLRMSSPLSSSKLEQSLNILRVKTAAEVRGKAAVQRVNSYRQSMSNYIERAVSEGRYEDAMSGYRRGAASGLWSAEDAEAGMLKIEREQKWETTAALIQTTPRESVRDLEQAVFTGNESKLFKNLKTPSERAKALNMAYGSLKTQEASYVRDAVTQIHDGTITTREQIDEMAGILGPQDRNTLYGVLEATPEQQARRLKMAPAIHNMIQAYDPQEDVDGTQAIAVRQEIKQLPEGYQRDYLDQLNEKIRANKPIEATAVSMIRSQAQSDFSAMRYGKWKVDVKTKAPTNEVEEAKRDAAMQQYSREISEFNRWAKRNPDATDEEAFKEINRIRQKNYEIGKAMGRETLRPPKMTAPDPREVQRKARDIRSQPQASADGRYIEGNIGPTSTGAHFDIKRSDRGEWDRSALDAYVMVNGAPLSSGKTVGGGRFGAPRSYGAHKGWDFAFGGKGVLTLTNGAVWLGASSTKHGDKARFRTPDGQVYEILHGKFEPA